METRPIEGIESSRIRGIGASSRREPILLWPPARLELPEQFAVAVRRAAARALDVRIVDQRREVPAIGLRICADEGVQGAGLGQQPVPPALHVRRSARSPPWAPWPTARAPPGSATGSMSRISLPMYWIWRRRPSCARMPRACSDRVDESLRQVELPQAPRVERDQRLAQVLQRVHCMLAPGLGRRGIVGCGPCRAARRVGRSFGRIGCAGNGA